MSADHPSFYDAVYSLVREIPVGRICTYGRIAAALGSPRAARAVGYALFHLPEGSDVPWQRVVNAKGEISPRSQPGRQRSLLESEGVEFSDAGTISVQRFLWDMPEMLHRWNE